jgi:hypothetical protein
MHCLKLSDISSLIDPLPLLSPATQYVHDYTSPRAEDVVVFRCVSAMMALSYVPSSNSLMDFRLAFAHGCCFTHSLYILCACDQAVGLFSEAIPASRTRLQNYDSSENHGRSRQAGIKSLPLPLSV